MFLHLRRFQLLFGIIPMLLFWIYLLTTYFLTCPAYYPFSFITSLFSPVFMLSKTWSSSFCFVFIRFSFNPFLYWFIWFTPSPWLPVFILLLHHLPQFLCSRYLCFLNYSWFFFPSDASLLHWYNWFTDSLSISLYFRCCLITLLINHSLKILKLQFLSFKCSPLFCGFIWKLLFCIRLTGAPFHVCSTAPLSSTAAPHSLILVP